MTAQPTFRDHIAALSPVAFNARLAQLTGKGYREYDFDDLDGIRGAGWTAFFEVEEAQETSMDYIRWSYPVTGVRLMGAWREDPDGNLFCGDASEVAEIVGEATVAGWEAQMVEYLTEAA